MHAMNTVASSIILALRITILLIYAGCSTIIWKYIKKKPLGMQTMLDVMHQELIPQSWILLLISTTQFILSAYFYPIYPEIARLIILTHSFFICGFLLHHLLTGLIQTTYLLSINPLSEVEDETIARITRASKFIFSAVIVTYQAYFNNAGFGPGFQALTDFEVEDRFDPINTPIGILAFLCFAILAYNQHKTSKILNSTFDVPVKFSIISVKGMLLTYIILGIVIFCVFNLNIGVTEALVILDIIAFVIAPFITIFGSPKMLDYTCKIIQFWINSK